MLLPLCQLGDSISTLYTSFLFSREILTDKLSGKTVSSWCFTLPVRFAWVNNFHSNMLRLTPETPVKPIHRQKFYDSCSKLHFSQWMGSLAVSFSFHALYFVVPTARIWDFCHAMWKFLVQCSHMRIQRGKRTFFIWSHWRHLQKHRKLKISGFIKLNFLFFSNMAY